MQQPAEDFRDHLATVDDDGSRKWLYPKQPKGSFYNARKVISYLLLAFFFSAPFIYVGGEQLLLFNLLERKFVLFGSIFYPHDFHIFMFAMAVAIIGIGIFTLVFGRLFCGWICPQTIFMEMLFRRIEYLIEGDAGAQKALNKAPMSGKKFAKKFSKHLIFLAISFAISNLFLAYIIGSQALWAIMTEGIAAHVVGLVMIIVFSLVFYMVFMFLREQVCTTICPYGRLQSVLLDKKSMVVAYDYNRGEARAKIKKNEDRKLMLKGDCIDCFQCVQVCPTGIDIRNGTQLECTNCTACIDACNIMMDAVGLEKGLIRYTSEEALETKTAFKFTKRIWFFSALLLALTVVFGLLLFARNAVEMKLLRAVGQSSHITNDGRIGNVFTYSIYNKTNKILPLRFELDNVKGTVEVIGNVDFSLPAGNHINGTCVISIAKEEIGGTSKKIKIAVYNRDTNEKLDNFETVFINR
jgi:cytochrome c oxidase accessory protein FixG